MRPLQLALICVVVVVLILVVYVLVAKPTVVLPTQTITLNDSTPLNAALKNSNSDINLKVRSDGTITASANGTNVATVDYNPRTLANAIDLGQKIALTDNTRRVIRVSQILLPGLTYALLSNGYAIYRWLPLELNVRVVPG
jgi:hypothetical protein